MISYSDLFEKLHISVTLFIFTSVRRFNKIELNSLESKATKFELFLWNVVTFQNLMLVLSHIKSRYAPIDT